ncbi:MAG TPA: AAA family ATPase, partial [Lachnospiraceae bacterium]|nr:AAA family ATPase [Lachnospiraceae bacterium]
MFFKDQGMRPTVRVFMREQQMRIDELILYRGLEQEPVLRDAARLMEAGRQDQLKEKEADKARIRLYRIMHGLVELAEESGFYGSLWHCYLTNLLVNHENSYSRSREIRGAVSSSINVAALHDFEIFRSLFDYDFRPLAHRLGVLEFDSVLSFSAASEKSRIYNRRIRDRICTLAGQLAETSTAQEMMDAVTRFYGEYGVGRFGLH